jgi:hypothetical protein
MNMSLIKILSFCIALCSVPGGSLLASTLDSNYDNQELEVAEQTPDSVAPSDGSNNDDLNALLADLQSDDLLDPIAETDPPPEQYAYQQPRHRAPESEIIVGRF